MSDIAKITGERIRNYRNKLKISQEVLAERSCLHTTYIGQLERGEKNATLESIEKVANALDVPLEKLFEKIIVGKDNDNDLSSKAYNLINNLSLNEQKAMLELMNNVIDYKKL